MFGIYGGNQPREKGVLTMGLIGKIISGGQAGVGRGAIEAAHELGFPYGGLIPKDRLAEDGKVPLKFSCMTEDTRKYSLNWADQNIIDSDATLILSRTSELTGDAKRIEEACKKYCKPYWIDNPDQPGKWAEGFKLLFWIEEKFGERGIVLNVAGSRESRDEGIQAATRLFVKEFLAEYGVNDPLPEVKIIGESPFVKVDNGEGVGWEFKAIDPIACRVIFASISPGELMKSLGEEHGMRELLTCGCGIADCAGIRYERFERTEDYVRWSFNYRGDARTLYFDRAMYERSAVEMLHEVYRTKVCWSFNGYEYHCYEDFKAAVDEFLAAKPQFKAIWDGLEDWETRGTAPCDTVDVTRSE